MKKITLYKKLFLVMNDDCGYNLDVVLRLPQERFLKPLAENNLFWRSVAGRRRTEYAVASCAANCAGYDLPLQKGCNLLHIINRAGEAGTLAEIYLLASRPHRAGFGSVTLLAGLDSRNAIVFNDFSAILKFPRRGADKGSGGSIGGRSGSSGESGRERIVLCRSILELEYSCRLRKRPEGDAGRTIHELIAAKFYLEMIAYYAEQAVRRKSAVNLSFAHL